MSLNGQSTPRSGPRWLVRSVVVTLVVLLAGPTVAGPAAARLVISGAGTGFAKRVDAPTARAVRASRTGQLKIAKDFQANGYSGTPSFAITYKCAGKSGTVSLKAGGSTTIANVRAGNCTVTEKPLTNPSGWTYAAPAYSPAQTVVVTAGKTTTVTVNNVITRDQGALKITKVFQANGYPGDPAFEIGYQCAGASGTVLLQSGATTTIPDVPTGDCTLTEKQLTNPPGWVYADPAYTPARTVPVVSGKTAEATVTNTIDRRSPQIDTVFTYPQVGAPDRTIGSRLVQYLDQTPAGSEVAAAFFVTDPDYPVIDALIRAHDRGVNVRVVLDSGDRQSSATNQAADATFERLGLALGQDTSAPSFAMQCENACISKEDGSINHNKFVAMSASGDVSEVVFQSTANQRFAGSGDTAWNAAVVSSGNPDLYASYRDYFNDLAARRSVPDNDYHAVRPPVTYGKFTPYYFPRTDGTDSVSKGLMSVDCSPDATTVNVMASYFTRPKVRNRLNDMAQAGCGVRVIARSDHITREFCETLLPPVDVRIGDPPSESAVGIHGKYVTISGGFGGTANRHLVWMGSHNFTYNALVRNDETFLLIDDHDVHDAFVDNFDRIWADQSLTPGCDRAGTTVEEAE
ncbi:MAG: DUF5979 domain-containing protein [Candidatus Nanopelagicales bacterium]